MFVEFAVLVVVVCVVVVVIVNVCAQAWRHPLCARRLFVYDYTWLAEHMPPKRYNGRRQRPRLSWLHMYMCLQVAGRPRHVSITCDALRRGSRSEEHPLRESRRRPWSRHELPAPALCSAPRFRTLEHCLGPAFLGLAPDRFKWLVRRLVHRALRRLTWRCG